MKVENADGRMPGMLRLALAVLVVLVSAAPVAGGEYDRCFEEAAQRYGVDPILLRAIAEVESGMNPEALNRNTDGSEDIGLMQINSRWLGVLRKYGIDREDLFDPCVSIHVGAWVLAQNVARYGATWRAVGAYNAVSEDRRLKYVIRVIRALKRMQGGGAE